MSPSLSAIIMVTSHKSFQGLLWPNLALAGQRPQLIIAASVVFGVWSMLKLGRIFFHASSSPVFVFISSMCAHVLAPHLNLKHIVMDRV
jgi:hypothetical protein